MSAEAFFIYMSYGVFFAFTLLLYSKSYILRGNKQLALGGEKISAKTILFPLLFIVFISFIIFTIFRDGSVGTDYYNYKNIFDSAAGVSWSDYFSSVTARGTEPLYALLCYVVNKYSNNFIVLLLIIYAFTFYTQVKLFSKTKNVFISLVTYIILFYPIILDSFNITRNCFACFISILGYIHLDEKKYFSAFLVFLCATLIHYTALFCFMVWITYIICNRKKMNVKRLFLLTLFGTAATIILIPILINIMVSINPIYAMKLEDGGISVRTMLFCIIVFIVSLIYSKKMIAHNRFNSVMIVVLGMLIVTIPIQMKVELIARMSLFANVAIFFLVCEIFSVVKITRKNLIFAPCALAVITLLSLGWFYIHVTSFAKDYRITDYKNMLFPNIFL